jgi:hypothetical protein
MSIKLNSILFASLFFFACADESPTSSVMENISEKEQQETEQRQRDACYNGTSTESGWCCANYGYQCNTERNSSAKSSSSYKYSSSSRKYSSSSTTNYYYSSSSKTSSNTQKSYLTQSKNFKLTLTYFKQETPDWDNVLGINTYNDADPSISFNIEFVDFNGQKNTKETGVLLKKQDTGLWSGRIDYTTTVPANTEKIRIYPKIIDVDVLDNDNYSSNYWYIFDGIGYLKNNDVQYDTDSKNTKCTLKWEWYLY